MNIFMVMSVTVETDHKPLEMILKKTTTPGPHQTSENYYGHPEISCYYLLLSWKITGCGWHAIKSIPIWGGLWAFARQIWNERSTHTAHIWSETWKAQTRNTEGSLTTRTEAYSRERLAKIKAEAHITVSPYWNYRDKISDGIMFNGERVIPKGMQSEMLQVIHSSEMFYTGQEWILKLKV